MATNTINFGKIYESTWWGVGVSSNNSSWGEVYRNIAGFPVFITLFEERVLSDLGSVESSRCISENLTVLSQPVITLLGDNPAYSDINTTYTDAGATAFDEFLYGDITNLIESESNIDVLNAGNYAVNYEVIDASNRTDTSKRDVYVLSELAIDYRDRIALDSGVAEKIECAEFNYNINWGYYLGLDSGFNRFLTEYQSRISTDLGTLESLNCVRNSYLNKYDWTYNYRVVDDLGSVESLGCINTNELIFKN
jgi:hypothetical protein